MDSENQSKVILIDWNIFVFRSIFMSEKNPKIPPTYAALNMLLSTLKCIGCHPEDTIILAIDSPKGSWRKQVDSNYKANRKALREKHITIDWKEVFQQFNNLIPQLKASTPFIPLTIDYYEADDIISVACRFFKNKKCIIVSSDSDYEQLAECLHVIVFSPCSKHKKYKHVANPSRVLLNKIQKETTDNLITPICSEKDYLDRLKIVDLLHLPPDVEREVTHVLANLEYNNYDLEKFPYRTLGERFMQIYNSEQIVSEHPKPKRKRKPRKKEEV